MYLHALISSSGTTAQWQCLHSLHMCRLIPQLSLSCIHAVLASRQPKHFPHTPILTLAAASSSSHVAQRACTHRSNTCGTFRHDKLCSVRSSKFGQEGGVQEMAFFCMNADLGARAASRENMSCKLDSLFEVHVEHTLWSTCSWKFTFTMSSSFWQSSSCVYNKTEHMDNFHSSVQIVHKKWKGKWRKSHSFLASQMRGLFMGFQ